MLKLRIGIILWALSWVPYGVIFGLDDVWWAIAIIFEIVLGIVGLAIAGNEFAGAVKESGWKHAPGVAWNALVHGGDVDSEPDSDR